MTEKPMGPRIIVLGSSNTDMIVKVRRLPRPGETVLGGGFSTAGGGKGANQAVAAARAGGDVVFIGRVGGDPFGEEALRDFEKDGINTEHVVRDETAPSGVALIIVDERGENCIAVAPGANANLSPSDVEAAGEVFGDAAVLLLQLEVPLETVRAAAGTASRNGVRVILNPAPAQSLDDSLLRCVSILTPNESEAEFLTGASVTDAEGARAAAETLRARGAETVLVTLGARGVYVSDRDFSGVVPGFSVEAVDTTAAGDVFNGALAVALAEGESLPSAARFANAAAALSVTKPGARPSAPSRREIEEFLKSRE